MGTSSSKNTGTYQSLGTRVMKQADFSAAPELWEYYNSFPRVLKAAAVVLRDPETRAGQAAALYAAVYQGLMKLSKPATVDAIVADKTRQPLLCGLVWGLWARYFQVLAHLQPVVPEGAARSNLALIRQAAAPQLLRLQTCA